jgi:hypothetical protein
MHEHAAACAPWALFAELRTNWLKSEVLANEMGWPRKQIGSLHSGARDGREKNQSRHAA